MQKSFFNDADRQFDATDMRGDIDSGYPAYSRGLMPYLVLIIAFVFFGLFGHEPWKADEPYVFGIIHTMDQSGDWLIPTLAGEPFMEKPPLYYWVATGFLRALSRWMEEPDAARMASGFFMLITCGAVAAAARSWWGKGNGRYAPVLVLACLGTLTQTHMMMPDVPLLTGFALSAWAFSRMIQHPLAGGFLLGAGVGVSFLSKGILGPAVIGLTTVLLPVIFRHWRQRTYLYGLLIAFVVSLPMLTIWPTLLYLRAPGEFTVWFWDNNFGRFFGFSAVHTGTEHVSGFWWQTLPWFTFPTLPLAMLAMWQQRRMIFRHPALQYGVVATAVMMAVLITSESVRAIYALPLLIPLAILAVPSISSLRGAVDRIFTVSSRVMFGLLSGMIWLVWGWMLTVGAPPHWKWLLRVMPMDFVAEFDLTAFLLALGATAVAGYLLVRWQAREGRALGNWFTGLTLSWILLSTLWMPWLDYGKSYQTVFEAIPWPESVDCVASIGLGESERGMLHYYTDRLTRRREIFPDDQCDTLLMQGYVPVGNKAVDQRKWELIWEGARPDDHWQRFWLYRKR